MQTLKLADDLFDPIDVGDKIVTIRTGHRDIRLGSLRFEPASGDLERFIEVEVLEVWHGPLRCCPEGYLKGDGFESATEAVVAMRRFYPYLTIDDEITAIEFN